MLRNSRLDQALAKLAAPGALPSPEGREIGVDAASAEDLLASVLTEIDETMLARRLNFAVEGGNSFACDVYGRRLLRLEAGAPVDAAQAGNALEDLDDIGRDRLRALFMALLAGARRVRVTASPLPEARNAARLGVGAEALATAWGLALGGDMPPAPTEALDRMEAAAGGTLGWMRLTAGDETRAAGAPDALERLRAFVADGLADYRAGDGHPADEPRCTVVGRQDGATALLVQAEAGGDCLLVLAPPAELAALVGAWRSVFR